MNGLLRGYRPQIIIAAAALLALWPAFGAGFVAWDDLELVTRNPLVANFSPRVWWSFDPELYIPLTFLSFQIQHLLFGFSSFAFHFGNIALHAANAVIVFLILERLVRERTAALLGALLFTVHPLVVEPTAWVSARKEVLMAFFVLLSTHFFLREEEEGTKSQKSVAYFLCALLSKVTALALPAVLGALLWLRDGSLSRSSSRRLLPFIALSVAFAVIALFGKQHAVAVLPLSSVMLLACGSFLFYLAKLIVPFGLSAVYPAPEIALSDPFIAAGVLVMIAFIVFTVVLLRRRALAGAGMLWVIAFLAPSFLSYEKSNVVMLAADRYMYLPLAGVALLVALGLRELLVRSERVTIGVSVVVIVVSIGLSMRQATVWASTETLFTNVLTRYPDEPIALNNIGFIRMEEGKLEEAFTMFEAAIRGNPDYADAYANIGALEGKRNNLGAAGGALRKALSIDSTHLQASHSLAGVYYVQQKFAEAADQYRNTLSINPDFAPSLYQLARAELRLGRRESAAEAYGHLLEIDSSYAGRDAQLDALL